MIPRVELWRYGAFLAPRKGSAKKGALAGRSWLRAAENAPGVSAPGPAQEPDWQGTVDASPWKLNPLSVKSKERMSVIEKLHQELFFQILRRYVANDE